MKRLLAYLVTMILAFGLCSTSLAQCPEDTVDLGLCDTLHFVPWTTDTCFIDCDSAGQCDTVCINDPGEDFPRFLFVTILVTHDSNSFWWESHSKWVQDSIAAFVIPLEWTSTNPTAYCSLSAHWNTNAITIYDPNFGRSIWRDFGGMQNRMAWLAGQFQSLEWSTRVLDMTSDSAWFYYANDSAFTPPHMWLSPLPSSSTNRRWWEGNRTLLATMTFTVEDTMHICMDSTWWPPSSKLSLARHDARVYGPRHILPQCMWAGPVRIEVTSPNGGETLFAGENHDITWSSQGYEGSVTVEYSTDGGVDWDTVIANTPDDGVHSWTVPNTPSTECRVRVSDAADGNPSDTSDSDFTIVQRDFTIDAEPETLIVVAGESVSCDVILDSVYGFSSSCTLTVDEDSLPTNTTYDFNPATIVPPDTSILSFHTTASTPAGTSTVIITGSETSKQKAGMEHSTEIVLIVHGLMADFSAEPESGCVPLSVQFEDLTEGNPTSWLWYFGDDSTSVEQHPIHTYNDTGLFSVKLVVSNQYCADSLVKEEYIQVFPLPVPDFSAEPESGCLPQEVQFQDLSVGNPSAWLWHFGDDSTSTEQHPIHTYNDTGSFSVKLVVSNQHCTDSLVKEDYIYVSFMRGDASGDCIIDVADVTDLINYLFIGGSAPDPLWVGDCNCDETVDVADVMYLINYLFLGGSPPNCP
jgi:PKD repeat protein